MIPKRAADLLEYINRLGYKPKGKEVKFLKDVQTYIERDMLLTKPMSDWLESIYKVAAGGGQYQKRGYV